VLKYDDWTKGCCEVLILDEALDMVAAKTATLSNSSSNLHTSRLQEEDSFHQQIGLKLKEK
jgi:hypothetical protein